MDCSPTIARTAKNAAAGISGCVDSMSSDPMERSALNSSSYWFMDCGRPRCTEPYTSGGGRWIEDTYIPDFNNQDSCWYKQYRPEELYSDCFKNRWIVVTGGSNALSLFIQIVNIFAPLQRIGYPEPLVRYRDAARHPMIDIVFRHDSLPIQDPNMEENGIVDFNMKRFCDVDPSLPCVDSSLRFVEGKVDWPPAYGEALRSFLDEAPMKGVPLDSHWLLVSSGALRKKSWAP